MTVTPLNGGRGPRTAFVLGGGGNLGAIQVGMLMALIERGERPDLVIGSSVGTLNGVAVAGDPTPAGMDRLRSTWVALGSEDIFPTTAFPRVSGSGLSGRLTAMAGTVRDLDGPWRLLKRSSPGMYSNEGLVRLIQRCASFSRFEDAPVPFEVVATNLRTGRAHWFDRGPILPALLASTALPAAFPPVAIADELYIDGAVVDNVPISRALYHGVDRIIVLHSGNFERPRPYPKRPLDVLLQSFSIARNHRFLLDLERVPDHIEVVVLPGIDPGPLKRNDFSRTAELIDRARAASLDHLDRLALGRRPAAVAAPEPAAAAGDGPVDGIPATGHLRAVRSMESMPPTSLRPARADRG